MSPPEAGPEKASKAVGKARIGGEVGKAARDLAAPAAVVAISALVPAGRRKPRARPCQDPGEGPDALEDQAGRAASPSAGEGPLAGEGRKVSPKKGHGEKGVAEDAADARPSAPCGKAAPGGPGRHRLRSVGNPGCMISASEGLT